jgi:hypothetical protein
MGKNKKKTPGLMDALNASEAQPATDAAPETTTTDTTPADATTATPDATPDVEPATPDVAPAPVMSLADKLRLARDRALAKLKASEDKLARVGELEAQETAAKAAADAYRASISAAETALVAFRAYLDGNFEGCDGEYKVAVVGGVATVSIDLPAPPTAPKRGRGRPRKDAATAGTTVGEGTLPYGSPLLCGSPMALDCRARHARGESAASIAAFYNTSPGRIYQYVGRGATWGSK